MSEITCLNCGDLLLDEMAIVECDGCGHVVHRASCGVYQLVTRNGEQLAYFFCDICVDVPDEFE